MGAVYPEGGTLEQFYFGRHWGSFDCPVEALVDAKFPKDFAEQVVRDAIGKDVFVAGDENDCTGVRIVRLGDKWDRWFVQFAPLYATAKRAWDEGQKMRVAATMSIIASSFLWTGAPRRCRPESSAQKCSDMSARSCPPST